MGHMFVYGGEQTMACLFTRDKSCFLVHLLCPGIIGNEIEGQHLSLWKEFRKECDVIRSAFQKENLGQLREL